MPKCTTSYYPVLPTSYLKMETKALLRKLRDTVLTSYLFNGLSGMYRMCTYKYKRALYLAIYYDEVFLFVSCKRDNERAMEHPYSVETTTDSNRKVVLLNC